jgi:glutamate racemase
VLATSGTLQSAQFAALLEIYGQGIKVVTLAGHGLVECVERGELQSQVTRDLLWKYLQPLLDEDADTLVLGCTHYPFLRPVIEALASDVVIIDTGAAVARQLGRRLDDCGIGSASGRPGFEQFWTSGDLEQGQQVMSQLWGHDIVLNGISGLHRL